MLEVYSGIIYKFTNKINKKVYVGQTTDELRRYKEHMLHSKDGDSPYFHRAIEKYGFENFSYKVLFRVYCRNKQDLMNTLNQKEITAIKFFNSHNSEFGYNLTTGGQGGSGRPTVSIFDGGTAFPVLKIDPETGKILKRYKSILEATKDCVDYASAGSISKVLRGKNYLAYGYYWKLDDGTSVEIPDLLEGYRIPSPRPIYKIDKKTGTVLEEFPSLSEACKSLGIPENCHGAISSVCRGKSKSAYGFIWAYKNSYESGEFNLSDYRRWTDRMIRVVQYTLDGKFIKYFDCIEDAVRETGADWSRITDSCKDLGSHHISAGFLWRYEKDFEGTIPVYTKISTRSVPVEQYSISGDFIQEFSTVTEAAIATMGDSKCCSLISRSCSKNKTSFVASSGGFMWKYKNIGNDSK